MGRPLAPERIQALRVQSSPEDITGTVLYGRTHQDFGATSPGTWSPEANEFLRNKGIVGNTYNEMNYKTPAETFVVYDPKDVQVLDRYSHGGIVDHALRIAREHHADGEAVGPTSQQRYNAAIEQLGKFEDKPPMDPAVMGQNWANAVQRMRVPDYAVYAPNEVRRDPAREEFVRARTPSARETGREWMVGDPMTSGAQFRQRMANAALGNPEGWGIGAFDFVPFAGGMLNATDVGHQVNEGDYLGAGISAGLAATLPFARYAVKPAMNAGKRALEIAQEYAPAAANVAQKAAPIAAAGAVMSPDEAQAADISKLRKVLPKFNPTGTVTTRTGADLLAKEPYLAQNVPVLSSVTKGMPFQDMSVGYEKIPNYLSPYKPLSFDKLEGAWAVPLLSDLTSSGVIVHEIGGKKIAPFFTEGGGDFTRGPASRGKTPAGWASMKDKAQTYMNSLERRIPEGDRVVGIQTTMAPEAGDSSDMFYQAMLRQMPHAPVTKASIADVDEKMSKKFSGWPGIMNTEKAEKFMQSLDLTARKQLAKTLDLALPQKAGFPDVGQTRFAITEPRLFGNAKLRAGYSVAELDPRGGVLVNPRYPHSNYTGSMAAPKSGGYLGGLPSSVHAKDIWSDWWNNLNPAAHDPSQWAKAQWGMMTQFPAQKIDAQMVDRVMKKQEEHKRIFGWRKGGNVSET
jgi:hypothetical protein